MSPLAACTWRVTHEELERKVIVEKPDILLMSPPCTKLSQLQNLTPDERRLDMRQFEKDLAEAVAMVNWCVKLARLQRQRGAHYIFEAADGGATWKLKSLVDFQTQYGDPMASVPGCSVGAKDLASGKPFSKKWKFLTSCITIVVAMDNLNCNREHIHQTVEGSSAGVRRSVQSQVYPPKLVNVLLKGFCQQQCMDTEAVNIILHIQDMTKEEAVLSAQPGPVRTREQTLAALRKMHVNLGHASLADMTRVLRHHGAPSETMQILKGFECDICDARRDPKVARASTVPKDVAPLRYVGLDVKWLPGWKKDQRVKALNIVDRASGLQQMTPFFETENSDLIRRVYRTSWTRPYGRPRWIKFDASRCNLGQPFIDSLERDGTTPLDVPGEAHEQMGDVEVQGRHFEEVLSKVLDEAQPQTQDEWLECVDVTVEAKNMLMKRGGHSAYQIVLGRAPNNQMRLPTVPFCQMLLLPLVTRQG